MLTGVTRGKNRKGGGCRVMLLDVDTWELAGFLNQLICHFMLVADMVGGGIWEFVNVIVAFSLLVLTLFPSC